jgi:phytoene dehydrogenase-like protein
MGALTQALARSAAAAGAGIRTGAEVAQIEVEAGRAAGVRLASGEVLRSRAVASSADAHVTFEKLLEPRHLPAAFRAQVARIDYSSASLKINLALSELPDFACRPGRDPAPHHRGTIHVGASLDHIERAYDDARCGRPSARPVIELTIPSVLDGTLAPAGHHVAGLFVQYAPYRLAAGSWETLKEGFADRCIAEVGRLAPNFPRSVLHRQVLTPPDLERQFGLTGGNIFQGAMSLNQLFSLRPVPGWSDYRTPLPGLYLCGAAAHPGGGVSGACGRNAALEIQRDL